MLSTRLTPTGALGFFRTDTINFAGAEIRVINSRETYFKGYRLNLEYCRIFVCLVVVFNQRRRDDDLTRFEEPPDKRDFFFNAFIMLLIIILKIILSVETIYLYFSILR